MIVRIVVLYLIIVIIIIIIIIIIINYYYCYHNYEIGSMIRLPLFMARSWNYIVRVQTFTDTLYMVYMAMYSLIRFQKQYNLECIQ